MPSLVGQAILHSVVAALLVEALVAAWRIADPASRIRLRAVALLVPVVALPAFRLVAPFRARDWFVDGWALFAGARWSVFTVAGIGVDQAATALAALLGVSLYLVDLVPFARARALGQDTGSPAGDAARVTREVAGIAARLGVAPPRVAVVPGDAAVLFCTGLRPTLVVSCAALDALDEDARRAALAHEVAHAAARDPAVGWALMLLRTLAFFNPVVHLLGRAIAHDLEERADAVAVRIAGGPEPMARALEALAVPAPVETGGGRRASPALTEALFLLRTRAVSRRVAAARAGAGQPPVPFMRLRVVLTLVALPCVLFFVV